uniref:Uncharacterized protein n=1 Tax=Setaria viridis TaxID=4556 RepID=A0A4U6WGW7_SETVI|nr:hypothetical protein SEVIR_1G362500v2 [Setaria viridis]
MALFAIFHSFLELLREFEVAEQIAWVQPEIYRSSSSIKLWEIAKRDQLISVLHRRRLCGARRHGWASKMMDLYHLCAASQQVRVLGLSTCLLAYDLMEKMCRRSVIRESQYSVVWMDAASCHLEVQQAGQIHSIQTASSIVLPVIIPVAREGSLFMQRKCNNYLVQFEGSNNKLASMYWGSIYPRLLAITPHELV